MKFILVFMLFFSSLSNAAIKRIKCSDPMAREKKISATFSIDTEDDSWASVSFKDAKGEEYESQCSVNKVATDNTVDIPLLECRVITTRYPYTLTLYTGAVKYNAATAQSEGPDGFTALPNCVVQ